jgi:valyl-tRNA synthetase
MHLLHPFMPFCTEEFYAVVKERNESDVLVVKQFEFVEDKNINLIKSKLFDGELLKSFVTTIRDLRNKNQIKPKEPLNLIIEDKNNGISIQEIKPIIIKLANLSDIRFETAKPNNSISFVISNGNIKCHLETGSSIDSSLQKDDLQKELAHLEGFLKSVNAKLSNEKFVAHAKPEVLALEQKKKSDAESRMNAVKESLLGLN